MADGLLSNILNFIDQRKQATMAGLGLLANNPQEYFTGRAEQLRDFTRAQEAGLPAERAQLRGLLATPEQIAAKQYADQQLQGLALGFTGNIKPVKPLGSIVEDATKIQKQTGLLGTEAAQDLSYRGSHTPPNAKTYGATLDDLGKIMPVDVYSSKGTRLYGLGNPEVDSQWFSAAYKAKGKPDADVTVYRAVPKGVKNINSGDWVTTSKKYAQDHGESALNGEYEIVSKKVKAKTLSSEGYPYEFGYNE